VKRSAAVVLLSGGMDSATLLYYVRSMGYDKIIAIGFDYGQQHIKELSYAKELCDEAGIEFSIVDLRELFTYDKSSLIKGKVLRGMGSQHQAVVNLRNSIFIVTAAKVALDCIDTKKYAIDIFYAPNFEDFRNFVDCRREFVQAISQAIRIGSDGQIRGVYAPFLNLSKLEILFIGKHLNVPYELTWSCYHGSKTPCRKCPACIERKVAFELLGIEDPWWEQHEVEKKS